MRSPLLASPLLLLALMVAACGDDSPPASDAAVDAETDAAVDAAVDARPPFVPEVIGRCADFDAERQPFFGDTHIHTSLSLDASLQGTRTTPEQAYRFAMGEPLGIQPFDADGNALRTAQLHRPLDFVVLSDHAEFLGDSVVCTVEGYGGYDRPECVNYRDNPSVAFVQFNLRLAMSQPNPRRSASCGPGGADCLEAALGPWGETRDAAEFAYDRTDACSFTSFVGYEWSGSPGTRNLHRNVVFRTDRVPDLPVSYFDEALPEGLWDALEAVCIDEIDGCDVLTIPHNSNLSSGLMFEREDQPMDAAYAARRRQFEPLIEIFQHKGDSECLPGMPSVDELCSFEKLPFNNLAGSNTGIESPPPATDFVRAALGEGLVLSTTLGENPFEYGVIASTDTHLGAPGLVTESDMPGHGGAGPAAGTTLAAGLVDYVGFNPGGLAVLWAEENSRESLWAAMRRREAYGTSGPRIVLRTFGGWNYAADLCGAPDLVSVGYADGVPMGGTLPPRPGSEAPTIVVSALRDPGTADRPGAPLAGLQIIKGWVEGGASRFEIFDVAGDAANAGAADPLTCAVDTAAGADALCAVFVDPSFDPATPAFYYARVVEVPTCRWTTLACNAAGVDCADPGTVPEEFEGCCDARFEATIRERAWSSPIWYGP